MTKSIRSKCDVYEPPHLLLLHDVTSDQRIVKLEIELPNILVPRFKRFMEQKEGLVEVSCR